MSVSLVTQQRCDLFTVIRTDMQTGERVRLSYPPADYLTCVHRANDYQRTFDHHRQRYDWRVAHCD